MSRAIRHPATLLLLLAVVFLTGMAWHGAPVMMHVHPFFKYVRGAYNFATLLFPALCTLGVIVSGIAFRRTHERSWRRVMIACGVIAIGGFGTRLYATHLEPRMLQVREVTIESDKVTREIRLLHITDIQSDDIGAYEAAAFRMMQELEPDVVIHTGDFLQPYTMDHFEQQYEKLVELWKGLEAPYGKLTVVGDVDWRVRERLLAEDSPIQTLENSTQTIEIDGTTINILGLSLEYGRNPIKGRREIRPWVEAAPEGDFLLLVGHAPDYIEEAQNHEIDLCLAGHTHGGQIRIPFYGPIVWYAKVPQELARGFHEVGKTRLNVSAGIGAEHARGMPPLRINCPPEMTLFRLVPKGTDNTPK